MHRRYKQNGQRCNRCNELRRRLGNGSWAPYCGRCGVRFIYPDTDTPVPDIDEAIDEVREGINMAHNPNIYPIDLVDLITEYVPPPHYGPENPPRSLSGTLPPNPNGDDWAPEMPDGEPMNPLPRLFGHAGPLDTFDNHCDMCGLKTWNSDGRCDVCHHQYDPGTAFWRSSPGGGGTF